MINKITFLLQRKKNASSHLFSKQLKNLQSNQLIVGFISIIYSSFASGLRAEGPKAPGASALSGRVGQNRACGAKLSAATIHTLSAHSYIICSAKLPD